MEREELVVKRDLALLKRELIEEITLIVRQGGRGKPRKWLKSAEVKQLLGISHGKLQTMRNTGIITFSKIGGNIYYDENDIMEMFEKNKVNRKCK